MRFGRDWCQFIDDTLRILDFVARDAGCCEKRLEQKTLNSALQKNGSKVDPLETDGNWPSIDW